MARKSFSLTRTPRFKTEDLNVKSRTANPLKSKITRQRLDRSGPLTIAQYRQLWNWENPEFGNGINAYVVKDTQGKLTADVDKKGLGYIQNLPNFHEILDSTVLYTEDRYLMQIFHNLTNINGILYFMKQMGVTPSNVLFDGEFNAVTGKDFMDPTFIRPDGVITKGNKIVFLETDCGTHEFKTLKGKSELYKKLIDSGVLQEMDFTDISIVIHSHSRRIRGIEKDGCMEPIGKYVKYLDFLDNEFNYIDQFGAGGGSYRGAYKGLDRAIQKAKKQWEDGMGLLGEKEQERFFRDPIAFRNKVEILQRKGLSIEDLQDDFEPVVDFEPDFNNRELTSELWVSGKNSEE